jgi:hypothetical protein
MGLLKIIKIIERVAGNWRSVGKWNKNKRNI